MARSRNIKPALYKNEALAECTLAARWIFPGLWMLADREGRLEDRPKRIKGELMPYDAIEIEPLLVELCFWGFIDRYQVGGTRVIQVVNFSKHQSPHHKEIDSALPMRPSVPDSLSSSIEKTEASMASNAVQASGLSRILPSRKAGKVRDRTDMSPRTTSQDDDHVGRQTALIPDIPIPSSVMPETQPIGPAVLSSDSCQSQNQAESTAGEADRTAGEKPSRTAPCPVETIVDLYHQKLPDLSRVRVMPRDRRKAINKMWAWVLTSKKSNGERRALDATQALEWFGTYFERASHNDFLMGRTGRTGDFANWRPDLEYLLSDRGMKQVIEKTDVAA